MKRLGVKRTQCKRMAVRGQLRKDAGKLGAKKGVEEVPTKKLRLKKSYGKYKKIKGNLS